MKAALFVSAVLNLALVGLLGAEYLRLNRGRPAPVACAEAPGLDAHQVATEDEPPAVAPEEAGPPTEPLKVESERVAKVWTTIDSPDIEEFATNLRNVGCPVATIRDILKARLENVYYARCATSNLEPPFWSCNAERDSSEKIQHHFEDGLKNEHEVLLRRLLGEEYLQEPPENSDNLISLAVFGFVVGPGPDLPRLHRLMSVFGVSERRSDAIRDRARGYPLPGDWREYDELATWVKTRLAELLTPEQFQEFQCRVAAFQLVESGVQDTEITPAEFRHIASIYSDIFGFADQPRLELFHTHSHDAPEDKQFQERIEEYLGKARYRDFQRGCDQDFKALRRLGEEAHLNQASIVSVYEIKQALEAEADRLPADPVPGSTELPINSALALTEVRRLLGDEAFGTYMARGQGSWLTNFSTP